MPETRRKFKYNHRSDLSAHEMEVDQRVRLLNLIKEAGDKGKNDHWLVYSEQRFHGYGEKFTRATLDWLVAQGYVRRERYGPKKFKSISNKEKYKRERYYYCG